MKKLLAPWLLLAPSLLAQPQPLAIVPAASFDREAGLAPEAIATAFASGLAAGTAIASASPLPSELGGVTLTVADSRGVGRPAPLFAVFRHQVNFLVPAGTAPGPAVVTLRSGSATFTGNLTVRPVAPAPASFTHL